jgi:hypothetical protein
VSLPLAARSRETLLVFLRLASQLQHVLGMNSLLSLVRGSAREIVLVNRRKRAEAGTDECCWD